MNITDLADDEATYRCLLEFGRAVSLDDVRALANEALDFAQPSANAHCVLGHVAEHEGDIDELVRRTDLALAIDPYCTTALLDSAYLDALRRPPSRNASAAARADHLFCKLDRFSGRGPQMRAQLDLVAHVLERPVPDPTPEALLVAESWQFCGFLAFEGELLERFDATCGHLLPPSERALLRSWIGVRHRVFRMDFAARRRWRLVDVETGEIVEADTLIDQRWEPDRQGLVLVVPVRRRLAVVGEPMLFDEPYFAGIRDALDDDDPLALARHALRLRVAVDLTLIERDRDERRRFVFPDLDPTTVPDDEEALYALIQDREPDATEYAQLLTAIVAERIITLRVPHTWELAADLLATGLTRNEAMDIVRSVTEDELWERRRSEAA